MAWIQDIRHVREWTWEAGMRSLQKAKELVAESYAVETKVLPCEDGWFKIVTISDEPPIYRHENT